MINMAPLISQTELAPLFSFGKGEHSSPARCYRKEAPMTSQLGSIGKILTILVVLWTLPACGSGGGNSPGTTSLPPKDSTPPTVSSTFPTDGTVGAPVGAVLTVTFNEPMNPATVNISTFTVKDSADNTVDGTVGYSGITATFTPTATLAFLSPYTVSITMAAQDLAGNNIAQDFVWSFTTGTEQPGTLDTSFGQNGVAIKHVTNFSDWANAIEIQTDGKIVVAGIDTGGLSSFVTRYHPDGTLDTTFGGTGTIFSAVNGTMALTIQPDGKIIVAGGQPVGTHYDISVARYNPDGTPDTGFGNNGASITAVSNVYDDIARAVCIQSDGKIVVAGYLSDTGLGYDMHSPNYDFALVRYQANGKLDTTFGNKGKVITDIGINRHDDARGIGIQSDGKIVVAGWSINNPDTANPNNDFALVRYNHNGTLDTTFGSGGKVVSELGSTRDEANALVIQANGRIVLAGGSYGADFTVARYATNGDLDMSFGLNGIAITPIGGGSDWVTALRLRPDGKIVAAGISETGGNFDFALARYNEDGNLDANFGNGGTVISDLGSQFDEAYALALQSDGKAVVAGRSRINGTYDIAIARYWP